MEINGHAIALQTTVTLPRHIAEYAIQTAASIRGHQPPNLASALEVCVEAASTASMQVLADAVNARQKALVILNVMGVVEALFGQEIELVEAPGEEWWLRFKHSGKGVKVGRCKPELLRAELARVAGAEIRA